MSGKIVSIHSFRGGTGKSNIAANLAAIAALDGRRVAVMDTDMASPGIHVIFGLGRTTMKHTLNDYLRGECEIADACLDMTSRLGIKKGKLFLIPSSMDANDITRILREGYEVGDLKKGFTDVIKNKNLDMLIIDTHPGLDRETLLSMATADYLFVVARIDEQDLLGTAATLSVARKLQVPDIRIVINKKPGIYEDKTIIKEVQSKFKASVATIIPLLPLLIEVGSRYVVTLRHPESEFTKKIEDIYRLTL
ncbi:MAG: MinD/ParA family protein [Candidatus Thorarchaeota archaeon]|nr:MAG: MinD/ParA family protein [Candidatus Thorarchaeota archaeon]RLI58876.1 MAG: MinD/ParA family protein [Candidatus Thorarchaeota archaeon]